VFLGPYQPYGVYIPASLPRPAPAALFLHGLDQNHVGSIFISPAQTYLGTGRALSEDPYLLTSFAPDGFDFPPPTLQLYPLARGDALSYRGIAHRDVLDVIDDASRRFQIDPNRISLQGASMGGIGAYRIGSLNPDRWSVVVPLIGFQATELLPLSQNLLNLPVRQINGAIDPLIPQELADASAARLDLLGFDYRYWLAFDRGHEAGTFIYECVFEQVAELVRDPNPPRVLYVLDPRLIEVDPESGLDLRFDSAYWVSGMVARDSNNLATIDARSSALPRNQLMLERVDVTVDNFEQGADLCGPNPDVQTGETWRERAVVRTQGEPLPVLNELFVSVVNVAAVTLDLTRAGLETNRTGFIDLSTDGDVSTTLTGFPNGKEVTVDDASVVVAGENGQVNVALGVGSHRLTW
jgi:pimeloyl-ACP methyl ester carboxylesterase